jgi:guanine deaminase
MSHPMTVQEPSNATMAKDLERRDVANKWIRGDFLAPHHSQRRWTVLKDRLLEIDQQGAVITLISSSEWVADLERPPLPPITRPGAIWLPGLIDTHVHYPQTAIIGSASGPLLTWLERSVFPEESKFVDLSYAEHIADRFCDHLFSQGTTCAAVYSSSHYGATDLLFKRMAHRGLRGDFGLTLMDRGAPEALLNPKEQASEDCERLISDWHRHDRDRLRFCVTPRFGLSCTPELLRMAGDLSERHHLLMQTHISENPLELTATAQAFPTSVDYLGVYEDHGLLSERSLFAHCIWLTESEWDRVADSRASITHCPDSNFFLGSGQMPLREIADRGVRMGIGSDIGAGRSFSLRRACARAYDASRITQSEVTPSELLWWATRGGAFAMGREAQVGCIDVGFEADLIAVRPPPFFEMSSDWSNDETAREMISQLIFCEDWGGVEAVLVRGDQVWCAESRSE